MALAVNEAKKGVASNHGGPFGAVIVKDGYVIAADHNHVTSTNDPTAHAEVSCIRKACTKLGTWKLEGCEIYCSCEPCPMCFGAIYWAGITKIYYGCTSEDAAKVGFADKDIYLSIQGKAEH